MALALVARLVVGSCSGDDDGDGSGQGSVEGSGGGDPARVLFGSTTPFDAATLAGLCPTHDDYVAAVTEATDAAVEAGFVLELDGDGVVAAAEDAPVPE